MSEYLSPPPYDGAGNMDAKKAVEIPLGERLQLATAYNSLPMLAAVAVGDPTIPFDFHNSTSREALLEKQQQGELTTWIDTKITTDWIEKRKHGISRSEWAERVTKKCFNDRQTIEQSLLLSKLGFDAADLLPSNNEAQQQVQHFLQTAFYTQYGGKDGNILLAETLTYDIEGAQTRDEILQTREILETNKQFFRAFLGKEPAEAFRTAIELRIAAKLDVFDYERVIKQNHANEQYYSEAVRPYEHATLQSLGLPDPHPGNNNDEEEEEENEKEAQEIRVKVGEWSLEKKGTKPEENEDAKFADPQRKAFGVFDGVGGGRAGEVASATARDVIEKQIAGIPDDSDETDALAMLEEILLIAHKAIRDKAEKNDAHRGMGTTATVVKILNNGKAIIGNVGDSRVYVMRRGQTTLEHLTLDDGEVRKLAEAEVREDAKQAGSLPDEALYEERGFELQRQIANLTTFENLPSGFGFLISNRKVVIQSLGSEGGIKPRMYTCQLEHGDRLLLMSDGVYDNLPDGDIADIMNNPPQRAALTLVHEARAVADTHDPTKEQKGILQRAKHDDMTAIVVEIEGYDDELLPLPIPTGW